MAIPPTAQHFAPTTTPKHDHLNQKQNTNKQKAPTSFATGPKFSGAKCSDAGPTKFTSMGLKGCQAGDNGGSQRWICVVDAVPGGAVVLAREIVDPAAGSPLILNQTFADGTDCGGDAAGTVATVLEPKYNAPCTRLGAARSSMLTCDKEDNPAITTFIGSATCGTDSDGRVLAKQPPSASKALNKRCRADGSFT